MLLTALDSLLEHESDIWLREEEDRQLGLAIEQWERDGDIGFGLMEDPPRDSRRCPPYRRR